MKPVCLRSILICSILCITLGSCKKKDDNPGPGCLFKVGIMADAAGFNDRGFNQSVLAGVAQATTEIPIYYEALIGSTDSLLYPGIQFVWLNVLPEVQPANLSCAVFDVDQASFPSGFLTAYWSFLKDPDQPVSGCVGRTNRQSTIDNA